MTQRNSKDIKKIADLMANLDFCMLTTQSIDGGLRARPMSNNGEVEFDGDVWFFTATDSQKVEDIESNPEVHLSYSDTERFLFISMAGEAEIVTDAKKKAELWVEDLERWFEDGPDSEEVSLIKVTPTVVTYWSKEDEGTIEFESIA